MPEIKFIFQRTGIMGRRNLSQVIILNVHPSGAQSRTLILLNAELINNVEISIVIVIDLISFLGVFNHLMTTIIRILLFVVGVSWL